MAFSDYYLFSKLKESLGDVVLRTIVRLQAAAVEHSETITLDYFYNDLELLIDRPNKCTGIRGDYK